MKNMNGYVKSIWKEEYGEKIYEAMAYAVANQSEKAIDIFEDNESVSVFTNISPFGTRFKEFEYGFVQINHLNGTTTRHVLGVIVNLTPHCATYASKLILHIEQLFRTP